MYCAEPILEFESFLNSDKKMRVVKNEKPYWFLRLLDDEKPYHVSDLRDIMSDQIYLMCDLHIGDPIDNWEDKRNRIIETINSVVKPDDHLLILGDLSAHVNIAQLVDVENTIKCINCKNLYLILGNNDQYDIDTYVKMGFKTVTDRFEWKEYVFTHIPEQVPEGKINVHGHMHEEIQYINVDWHNHINIWDNQYVPIRLSKARELFNSGYYIGVTINNKNELEAHNEEKYFGVDETVGITESNTVLHDMGFTLRNLDLIVPNITRSALETGDFEKIQPNLLKMIDRCYDLGDVEYLIKDCSSSTIQTLEKYAEIVESVERGEDIPKNINRKTIQSRIDKGLTSEKIRDHILWLQETYKPALQAKKKELKHKVPSTESYISKAIKAPNYDHALYICLFDYNSPYGRVIKMKTDSRYNHAAIATNISLNPMYTFRREVTRVGTYRGFHGFSEEYLSDIIDRDKFAFVRVIRVNTTPYQYDKACALIDGFVKHPEDTNYDFVNILRHAVGKGVPNFELDENSLMCSSFVGYIMREIGIPISDKPDNLITPGDIARGTNGKMFVEIYDNLVSKYNPKKLDKIVSESVELYMVTETSRSKLPDSEFGIPEERKYPLDTEKHVRSAIKLFNHCEPKYEKELADNIIKKLNEYDIDDVSFGKNNRFGKYYKESSVTEACKDLETARKFVREVGKLAKKYDANYFVVTDGASGTSNNGNPAVKHARDCQIEWEKEHGFDPDEDWSKTMEGYQFNNNAYVDTIMYLYKRKGIDMDRGPSSLALTWTGSSWNSQEEPTMEDVYVVDPRMMSTYDKKESFLSQDWLMSQIKTLRQYDIYEEINDINKRILTGEELVDAYHNFTDNKIDYIINHPHDNALNERIFITYNKLSNFGLSEADIKHVIFDEYFYSDLARSMFLEYGVESIRDMIELRLNVSIDMMRRLKALYSRAIRNISDDITAMNYPDQNRKELINQLFDKIFKDLKADASKTWENNVIDLSKYGDFGKIYITDITLREVINSGRDSREFDSIRVAVGYAMYYDAVVVGHGRKFDSNIPEDRDRDFDTDFGIKGIFIEGIPCFSATEVIDRLINLGNRKILINVCNMNPVSINHIVKRYHRPDVDVVIAGAELIKEVTIPLWGDQEVNVLSETTVNVDYYVNPTLLNCINNYRLTSFIPLYEMKGDPDIIWMETEFKNTFASNLKDISDMYYIFRDIYDTYSDVYLDVNCAFTTIDFPSGKEKTYRVTNYHQFEKINAISFNSIVKAISELSKKNKKWLDQVHNFIGDLQKSNKAAFAINESANRSAFSNNFKPKTMDKNFKYIDINSQSAIKYLKQDSYCNRLFDFIQKYNNGEIVIDADEDKLAGHVFIGNEKKDPGWITSLVVKEEYRGYGLGKTLMEHAIHKYGGVDLCVYKDNDVAIKIYKDLGFEIVGDYKPDKSMYYMKLKGTQILESTAVQETSLKSTIDKDYKPRGRKSLSEFRKQRITKSFIDEYKSKTKIVKHIDYNDNAYAWLDGDNVVAVVAVDEDHEPKYGEDEGYNWITAIEVLPEYQGYGLGNQLLDYAVKQMHGNALTVSKDNEIAKSMYEKYGFKASKKSIDEVRTGKRPVYYMYLK